MRSRPADLPWRGAAVEAPLRLRVSLGTCIRWLVIASVLDGLTTASLLPIPFFGAHLMAYRVMLPASAALAILRVALRGGRVGRGALRVRGFVGFLLAWWLFAAISLFWVLDLSAGVRQVYFLFEGVLLVLLLITWFDAQGWLDRLAALWLAMFGLLSAVGVWEALTSRHLPGSRVLLLDELHAQVLSNMPTATFGNPNNFAFFLVLTVPFALAYWRHRARGVWAVLAFMAVVAAVFVLVFTRARLGYIGLALVLVTWYYLPRLARPLAGLTLRWRLLLVPLVLAVPLLSGETRQLAREQLESLQLNLTAEGLADDPRLQLQRQVVDVIRRTNGFGVGAGNIETYMAQYEYSQIYELTNPHGWWVEIAGNYGVPFFVGYSVFYVSLLRQLWYWYRCRAAQGRNRELLEGAVVALLAYPIASFGPSSIAGSVFHWFFLGFCLAVLNHQRLVMGAEKAR